MSDGHLWRLTAHVCATCFARVLARPLGEGRESFRCSNCGVERAGESEVVVCACGLPDARCEVNGSPTPLEPAEIIAVAVC